MISSFAVRPVKKDLQYGFNVYFSPQDLTELEIPNGDLCEIKLNDAVLGAATSWPAAQGIHKGVVQMSRDLIDHLKRLYGFRLEDKVSISRKRTPLPTVDVVLLHEDPSEKRQTPISEAKLSYWTGALITSLFNAKYIYPGLRFKKVQFGAEQRSFIVTSLSDSQDRKYSELCLFKGHSQACLESHPEIAVHKKGDPVFEITYDGVGGLSDQIDTISQILSPLGGSSGPWHRGIIIYGAEGTGKSLMLQKVAALPWNKVFYIESTQSAQTLPDKEVFATALVSQPSLIVIDDIHNLFPSRVRADAAGSTARCDAFVKGLKTLRDSQVFVVAAASHPNNVLKPLRASDMLSFAIELPIPTTEKRMEILHVLRNRHKRIKLGDASLNEVGKRTHGYVGHDLAKFYVQLGQIKTSQLWKRRKNKKASGASEAATDTSSQDIDEITNQDIEEGLKVVGPTALQEIILEVPNIRWSDIGGQDDIKARLQKAVEWPLKYGTYMKRANRRPVRGILLYGPPGCSKTLMAKALANEAGVNFMSVKGAELVSMYVGESERAVREVFKKARAAAPCIIFFDEIDSLTNTGSGSGGGGSQSYEMNIKTTFLTEMDGIEELNGVLVIGATNNPDKLPPELLRPGRIERLEYVAPPNLDARKEIFKKWIAKCDQGIVSPGVLACVGDFAARTEGSSGADIVHLCLAAADAFLDRATTKIDNSTSNDEKISREDFESAIQHGERSITPEMVRKFEVWRMKYRSV
ncbi:MAG: AAA+-type ATPase [Cirrosporium novae-zelandiae]|nr:MAG: AAA+-type ATPase [Cirrosporium novae-zelandiae]